MTTKALYSLGAALLVVGAGLLLGGCVTVEPDAAESPLDEPVVDVSDIVENEPVEAPLAVSGSGASYVSEAGAEPIELEPGDTVEVGIGESVQVHDEGSVRLEWPAGVEAAHAALSGALLREVSLQVDDADSSSANVELTQAGGAARYWVSRTEPPTSVQVNAGAVSVLADQGAAGFSVFYSCDISVLPGGESKDDVEQGPLVWVVVASGEVEVKGCRPPGESGSSGPSQVCVVTKGKAASFTEDGTVVDIETLRPSVIEAWFAGVRGGACEGPQILVAQAPDLEVDEPAEGTPIAAVELPVPEVTLTIDHDEIPLDACTTVRWTAANVSKVWLEGVEVADLGSKEVCPKGDTVYTLSWTGYDGTEDSSRVKVRVVGGERREEDEDDDEPEPEETECVGDECEPTALPFVPFPTSPPLEPTQPPPTDEPVEPTDPPPPPTDEPATEPPPEPTDPPPEPTDPPPEPTDPPPEPTDPPEPEP